MGTLQPQRPIERKENCSPAPRGHPDTENRDISICFRMSFAIKICYKYMGTGLMSHMDRDMDMSWLYDAMITQTVCVHPNGIIFHFFIHVVCFMLLSNVRCACT